VVVIDRNAIRVAELAWSFALLAELGHERESLVVIITREYLHSMTTITDEQETSMMVEHQARWVVELAISTASLLGADRDLDSRITIKSVVSHLFHNKICSISTRYTTERARCNARATMMQQAASNETTKEHEALAIVVVLVACWLSHHGCRLVESGLLERAGASVAGGTGSSDGGGGG